MGPLPALESQLRQFPASHHARPLSRSTLQRVERRRKRHSSNAPARGGAPRVDLKIHVPSPSIPNFLSAFSVGPTGADPFPSGFPAAAGAPPTAPVNPGPPGATTSAAEPSSAPPPASSSSTFSTSTASSHFSSSSSAADSTVSAFSNYPTTTLAASTPTPSTISNVSSSFSSSRGYQWTAAGIAGLVFGVLAFLGMLGVVAYLYLRRRRGGSITRSRAAADDGSQFRFSRPPPGARGGGGEVMRETGGGLVGGEKSPFSFASVPAIPGAVGGLGGAGAGTWPQARAEEGNRRPFTYLGPRSPWVAPSVALPDLPGPLFPTSSPTNRGTRGSRGEFVVDLAGSQRSPDPSLSPPSVFEAYDSSSVESSARSVMDSIVGHGAKAVSPLPFRSSPTPPGVAGHARGGSTSSAGRSGTGTPGPEGFYNLTGATVSRPTLVSTREVLARASSRSGSIHSGKAGHGGSGNGSQGSLPASAIAEALERNRLSKVAELEEASSSAHPHPSREDDDGAAVLSLTPPPLPSPPGGSRANRTSEDAQNRSSSGSASRTMSSSSDSNSPHHSRHPPPVPPPPGAPPVAFQMHVRHPSNARARDSSDSDLRERHVSFAPGTVSPLPGSGNGARQGSGSSGAWSSQSDDEDLPAAARPGSLRSGSRDDSPGRATFGRRSLTPAAEETEESTSAAQSVESGVLDAGAP